MTIVRKASKQQDRYLTPVLKDTEQSLSFKALRIMDERCNKVTLAQDKIFLY